MPFGTHEVALSCEKGLVRLLHVAAGNLFGGVEVMLSALASVGDGARLHSEFALCFEGRLERELLARGAVVHRLGATRLRNPASLLRSNARLVDLLARRDIDAVAVHSPWLHLIFGPTAKACGRALLVWCHNAPLRVDWIDRASDRVRADHLILNSRHTEAAMRGAFAGVPRSVILPAVELSAAAPAEREAVRRELGTPLDRFVVMFAARLQRWKGHRLLLEAFDALQSMDAAAQLEVWLCGGPQRREELSYLEELQRFAAERGLGARVRFLGQRSDVPRLMRAADLFCQPNTEPEPFGVVLIEALHAGLPVVSTELGAAREIVDASCGVLTRVDPEAVARAWFELWSDPERRRRLGAAGPSRARLLCEPGARQAELACVVERVLRAR